MAVGGSYGAAGIWLLVATAMEAVRIGSEADHTATGFYLLIGLALLSAGVASLRQLPWARWVFLALAMGAMAGAAVALTPLIPWLLQLLFTERSPEQPWGASLFHVLALIAPFVVFALVPLLAAIALFWAFRARADASSIEH